MATNWGLWVAVLLIGTTLLSQRWIADESSPSELHEDDTMADQQQHSHGFNYDTAADEHHAAPDGDDEFSTAVTTKEEQLAVIRTKLRELRAGRLQEALSQLHRAETARNEAKRGAGWIYTSEERARISRLDHEVERGSRALAAVQREELALEKSIKPLYGIVSLEFYNEQRRTIASSIATVQKMSYDNAWYSGLFNAHRAESFSDLILQFFIEWLVGYVVMYPFAVLHYALWVAPWSIYEYSSSTSDVLVGIVAWLCSVGLMMMPLVALGGGMWLVYKHYGDQIAAAMRERQERRRRF